MVLPAAPSPVPGSGGSARRIFHALLVPLVAFFSATVAFGDGFIYVHHPHPHPPSPPHVRPPPRPPRPHFPLEVTRHKVVVEVDEVVARTRVEETFHNPNNVQLEGDYLFPLPPDAAVSSFTMKMGGVEVSGEVLEKDKARQIYEQIVRQVKDPGLLEYVERGLFRARVFPIPARGDVDIAIEYSEKLTRERGTATYRYPLDTGKYSAGNYKNVIIDARLHSSLPVRSIHCPTHDAALITKKSDQEARISFEAKEIKADKDFIFTWNVSEDALAPVVLAHRGAEAEGFFFLSMAPRPERPQEAPPKDVAFVIDTSGSMLGTKMDQVREALRYCISNLNEGDRFNIIDFATEARRFRDSLVPVNDENRRAATVYIDGMKARGGTNIEEAARFGLADLQSGDRLSVMVLLTDGEPTIGVITPSEILKTIQEKNERKRRIFVFGVGNDLNAKLLDAVASETRGATQYIRAEENIEVPLANFYDKIDFPVFTDIRVEFTTGDVEDVFPRPLPDLFRGEQLDIFGRYGKDGQKTVVVRGRFQGEERVFEYSLPFEAEEAHSLIPRLWAMRKIGYLLEQMRLSGESGEVRDEVIRLSKRYGVITPYTSYLIVEEEQLARRSGRVPRSAPGVPALRSAASDVVGGAGRGAAEPERRRLREELEAAADAFDAPSGAESVGASRSLGALKKGDADGAIRSFVDEKLNRRRDGPSLKEVDGRTFYRQGTRWVDAALLEKDEDDLADARSVKYLSDEYFRLLGDEPGIGKLLSVGEEVTFLWKGEVIRVDA